MTVILLVGLGIGVAIAFALHFAWKNLELWEFFVVVLVMSTVSDLIIGYEVNKRRPRTGPDAMIGEIAVVEDGFDGAANASIGRVRYRSEFWRARVSEPVPLQPGDKVRIVSIEGLWLEVSLVKPESN